MREIFRVLKPGGIAVLMISIDMDRESTLEEKTNETFSPEKREMMFGQYEHVRIYGLDYFKRLADAGFSVERIVYPDDISSKYAFLPGEEIILAHKD